MEISLADLERWGSSPLARFRPWAVAGRSPQLDYMRAAAAPARILRAGNQSGKTLTACADLLLELAGWHPYAPAAPPLRAWMSVLDWDWGIGQVLWPTMEPLVPTAEVRSISFARRTAPEIPAAIRFRNGSELVFKSAASGRAKYQGAPLHRVHVDEEHPAEIVEECGARLVRYGGRLSVTLTPVMRERWVLELERRPGTVVVRASMSDAAAAGILDTAAVARYLAGLPARQRAVREFGDYAPLEGLVYPEFSREVHGARPVGERLVLGTGEEVAPWPLPQDWPRTAAIDFGFINPTAVVVLAEGPWRRVFVERVVRCAEIRASEWAGLLRDLLPPLARALVADHDRGEREELRARGVPTRAARKDVVRGIEAVQRLLMPLEADGLPGLVLCLQDPPPSDPRVGRLDAEMLAWELEGYRYPERRDAAGSADRRDEPLKRDDHAVDALRYAVMDLEHRAAVPRLGAPPPSLDADAPTAAAAGARLAAGGRDARRAIRDLPGGGLYG